jgi:head-tail adaptor
MIGQRKQIKLEKWVAAKDGLGDSKEYVTNAYGIYAEVERLSGGRASLNGQTNLDNIFQFRMRFDSFDPTGNWRIVYDRRRFTVHSIEKENQNRFYWIFKAEAVGTR